MRNVVCVVVGLLFIVGLVSCENSMAKKTEEIPDTAQEQQDTLAATGTLIADTATAADETGLPDEDTVDEMPEEAEDTAPQTDDMIIPDEEAPDTVVVPADLCQVNTDCAWQYRCATELTPKNCIKAGTCDSDEDCTAIQMCVVKDHWKECALNSTPTYCTKDEECPKGAYCFESFPGIKTCRSKNECENDTQCPKGYQCLFEDDYYHCIDTEPCKVDTDCNFGYKCEQKTPQNECTYASTCITDADCSDIEACVVEGNWTVCKIAGGGFCTSDANCEPAEYCDLKIGFAGICKSRNQCYKDADCNDAKLICESNGVYNECVPANPSWCLVDAMCEETWACIENECRPPYYDLCTEIAGKWKVWFSGLSAVTFKQDEIYEFIPKNGCNGDIKKEGATIFMGSFSQTATSKYALDFYLIYQCDASVLLGNLMNITCPDGSAQLGRE